MADFWALRADRWFEMPALPEVCETRPTRQEWLAELGYVHMNASRWHPSIEYESEAHVERWLGPCPPEHDGGSRCAWTRWLGPCPPEHDGGSRCAWTRWRADPSPPLPVLPARSSRASLPRLAGLTPLRAPAGW